MIAVYTGSDNKAGQGTGIAMLFVYVVFFAGCIDVSECPRPSLSQTIAVDAEFHSATYVYCSEIFPTVHRAQGMSYSICFFFVLCAMWTSMAPVVMARIAWGYYCSTCF